MSAHNYAEAGTEIRRVLDPRYCLRCDSILGESHDPNDSRRCDVCWRNRQEIHPRLRRALEAALELMK